MHDVLAQKISHPFKEKYATLTDALLVITGSLFVASVAQITIPVPFSPVPITGQTFAVLLIGMVLGPKRGALSLLLYLFEGGVGLPFFAGGRAGLAVIVGPTGGYLLGFIAAAWIVGKLAQWGMDRNIITTFLAFLIGSSVIYLFGVVWLSAFVGFPQAVQVGMLPFLIGDLLKALLAGAAMPLAWRFVNGLKG